MSAYNILIKISDTYHLGWNDASLLDIALNYIDNQGDNGAFEDYVAERAQEEEEVAEDEV